MFDTRDNFTPELMRLAHPKAANRGVVGFSCGLCGNQRFLGSKAAVVFMNKASRGN